MTKKLRCSTTYCVFYNHVVNSDMRNRVVSYREATSEICYKDYRLINVYQKMTEDLRQEVVRFWLNNKALPNIDRARKRSNQVVFVVRNQQNEIAGVNTVYISKLPQDRNSYYFYRVFICPKERTSNLMQVMSYQTRKFLRTYNPEQGIKPAGMIIETENPKLMRHHFFERYFKKRNYSYLGKNSKQQDIWLDDFSNELSKSFYD